MNTVTIILVFFVILIVSVIVISIVQKREQQKAEIRLKINQFRFRASQALDVLDNMSNVPVGPETRRLLVEYVLANLRAIQKLAPDDASNKNQMESVSQKLNQLSSPADSKPLVISNNPDELKRQINSLSKLAKFLHKLQSSNAVSKQLVPVAYNQVVGLIAESKICAYIQQGKHSLEKHEYVPAQRNFIMAQQMLLKIANKPPRLQKLEEELKSLVSSRPEESANTQLNFNQVEESPAVESAKNESQEDGQPGDSIFGPRKKW